MKKFVLLSLILIFSAAASDAAYYNDDIPANAGSFTSYNSGSYNISTGSQVGSTYYGWNNKTQSYTGYTRQGNDIYGSDGTHYTQFDNVIQNNAPQGQSFQVRNNLVQPLY